VLSFEKWHPAFTIQLYQPIPTRPIEVQTLLMLRSFKAEAVECPNCRHLDTRMVKTCAVCAHETRELSDVSDALVDLALRNGADIRFIDGDPDMEKAGHVAALLRFRADQNTAEKKMAV